MNRAALRATSHALRSKRVWRDVAKEFAEILDVPVPTLEVLELLDDDDLSGKRYMNVTLPIAKWRELRKLLNESTQEG